MNYKWIKDDRLSKFHSGRFFVFHEVTSGPFDRSSTVLPDWAPEENNHKEILAFLKNVEEKIKQLKSGIN